MIQLSDGRNTLLVGDTRRLEALIRTHFRLAPGRHFSILIKIGDDHQAPSEYHVRAMPERCHVCNSPVWTPSSKEHDFSGQFVLCCCCVPKPILDVLFPPAGPLRN